MGRDLIYSNRGVCATVFLDAEVHARLKADARARKLSLSRFVNQLGVAYMRANPAEQPSVDEGAPVPAPPPKRKAATPPGVDKKRRVPAKKTAQKR